MGMPTRRSSLMSFGWIGVTGAVAGFLVHAGISALAQGQATGGTAPAAIDTGVPGNTIVFGGGGGGGAVVVNGPEGPVALIPDTTTGTLRSIPLGQPGSLAADAAAQAAAQQAQQQAAAQAQQAAQAQLAQQAAQAAATRAVQEVQSQQQQSPPQVVCECRCPPCDNSGAAPVSVDTGAPAEAGPAPQVTQSPQVAQSPR